MSPFRIVRDSLRIRVMLIPSGILLIGMLAAVAVTLFAARARIDSEIESGIGMAHLLIGYAREDFDDNAPAALLRLEQELKQIRHVRVIHRLDPGLVQPPVEAAAAPGWFLAMFEPPRIVATYPLTIAGKNSGDLVMWSWPADEVAEIWNGLIFLVALLGAAGGAIVGLLYLSGHFALKPLRELEEGLDRLEQGRFEALKEIKISELRRIGERFNRLASSLARTEAQNHRLVDRLLSVQEAERKELARELHDEYGAALFGIRAAASCIIEAIGSTEPAQSDEIRDQAEAISRLADSIQKQNYRILDRIQPVVLHQMGLEQAVRHLVDTWRATQRSCTCDLEIAALPACSEDASLAGYRIIQECLTNIARHARATHAKVSLIALNDDPAAGARTGLRICVEDDGQGLPEDFRSGFGFLGMNERVHKFGGHLAARRRAAGGTCVEAVIPLNCATADQGRPGSKALQSGAPLKAAMIEEGIG